MVASFFLWDDQIYSGLERSRHHRDVHGLYILQHTVGKDCDLFDLFLLQTCVGVTSLTHSYSLQALGECNHAASAHQLIVLPTSDNK